MNSIRFVLYNKTYLAYLNEEFIGGIYKSDFKKLRVKCTRGKRILYK